MEKIKKLRQFIKREKIDGYLIPKNDQFFGEYIPDYNDRLKFISNFSGSYGYSLILKNKNYLFVDGRYTLQAKNQSGKFFKVITFPNQMPKDILKNKKLCIGFDPQLITRKILNIFFSNKKLKYTPIKENLIDKIWKRAIKKNKSKFYILPSHSVGADFKFKIKKISNNLKKKGADYQLITACENNAWLLNIRGQDTKFSPIPNCYVLIDNAKNIILFCDKKKLSGPFKRKFDTSKFLEIN